MTQNNKWIEWVWTAEKPYPETLDTMVYVKFRKWPDAEVQPVGFLWHPENEYDHWFNSDGFGDITHYKLA